MKLRSEDAPPRGSNVEKDGRKRRGYMLVRRDFG